MAGMPIANERCFVLCRHTRMAIIPPAAPPITAHRNNVLSGTLLPCLLAKFLSCAIK